MTTFEQTKIRFWGGLRTIGGTIVTVEYKDSRVVFDFGLKYDPATNFFDGKLKLRTTSIVQDYLRLGMIPKIDGLYSDKDLAGNEEVIPAELDKRQTAVIISHIHLDHIGAMGTIAPEIPVYLTSDSLKLYRSLDTIGEGVPGNREYQLCDYEQSFRIGEITVTPIQVDHDVLGACAFHIETPEGSIFYTGDLRLHGNYPERTEQMIQKAKERGFDVLIMEGTTLRSVEEHREPLVSTNKLPENLLTEAQLPRKVEEVLEETNGIGCFNIYNRNIDRIEGILTAGKNTKRTVVFEPETAYLASLFIPDSEFAIYLSSETIAEVKNGSILEWKKSLLERYEILDAKKINEHPSHYFVQNSYENTMEMFDLNVANGVYIHSNGVPLGDFDPSYQNLQNFLERIGIEHVLVGTSGHAIPNHLQYILDEFDPDFFIPLHSFHPERLIPRRGRQVLPEYGVTYLLINNELTKMIEKDNGVVIGG
ncbi:MBL fold metallo-hydrolase [Cytobacillus depressus]|uniref:MBL fold metallo-hydrolase n=1 Tax=Cytobacillus depressus TaxID=1602942 RepID=UPI001FECB0C9|nr:MBL fold metallo-hydrolase [Cytobacillus depressus]